MLCLNYEHTLKCITVDDSGEFRLWELAGQGTGYAMCLQDFRSPFQEPNGPAHCFALPFSSSRSIAEYSEMLVG